jgi:hypothetical protein
MKKLAIATTTLALVSILLAGPAFGGMKFGVRQYSFHNAPLPSEQTMGAYFGLSGGGQVDVIFGLDYWKYSISSDMSLETEDLEVDEAKLSAGTTQLHGGIKLYLRPQAPQQVSPYLIGELFYGMGSVEVEAGEVSVSVDPLEDALSPFGFVGGFGAEYFVSDFFAVGGEVGLRYAVTKSEGDVGLLDQLDLDLEGLTKPVATTNGSDPETKLTTMTIYTGISVTFAF